MKILSRIRELDVAVIFGYFISILGLVYFVEEFSGVYFFLYVFVLSQSIAATPGIIARFIKRSADKGLC